MQNFVPDTWTEFYFHPTLNPFGLPFILGLFVASVWLIVILAIASVEDVCRQLPFQVAMLYLFALLGVCAGCYLFFSLTTLYYLGYPFAALFPLCPLSLRLRTLRGQASQQGALPALRCME